MTPDHILIERSTTVDHDAQKPKHLDASATRRQDDISPGGLSYLQELVNQYLTLPDEQKSHNTRADELARVIVERRSRDDGFTWDDVHAMELAMVELLPEDDLRAWAWSLRQDCIQSGQLFVDSHFAAFLTTRNAPNSSRAYLRRLLIDLHRSRTLQRVENDIRKKSLKYAGLGFLVIGLCVPLIYLPALGDAPTHAFVLLFGALGGLISIMQRIRKGQVIGVSSVISYETVPTWQFMLSPLVGAVAGILVYLAFQANIFGRMNFDYSYSPINGPPGTPHQAGGVAKPPELAYLLIWAFFAGFSERLLPDSLDISKISSPASIESSHLDPLILSSAERTTNTGATKGET
jgi:hypothetical protein